MLSTARCEGEQKGHDSFASSSLPLIALKTFVKSKVFSKPVNDTYISLFFLLTHLLSFCLAPAASPTAITVFL